MEKQCHVHDLPNTYGNFQACRLTWTEGNFLQMSERTCPIEKGPLCLTTVHLCFYVPAVVLIGQYLFSFRHACYVDLY